MNIFESSISNVKRNRDFGMVEARVTLIAKTRPGQPVHPITLRTHVPERGDGPLRDRLVADAALLATQLSRPDHPSAA